MKKMAAKPAADDATKVSFSYLDIGGYNYAASRYEKDGTLHPDRVIVGSGDPCPRTCIITGNW